MENGCRLCMMIYGFEEPKYESIAGSHNFIAVLDSSNELNRVAIISKKPEISIIDARNNHELALELSDIIERSIQYIFNKLKIKDFAVVIWSEKCTEVAPLHKCLLLIPVKPSLFEKNDLL